MILAMGSGPGCQTYHPQDRPIAQMALGFSLPLPMRARILPEMTCRGYHTCGPPHSTAAHFFAGFGGCVAMPPDSYFAGAYNPGGRRAFGMATLNGKIWVAGGITGADPDLVDNSGRRFTPCHPSSLDISAGGPPGTAPWPPGAIDARRVFTATSVVAALMTKTHAKVLDKVHCYDPSTNVWTEMAPLPVPVWGNTLTAVGNKLYSVGGFLYGTRQFAWELPEIAAVLRSLPGGLVRSVQQRSSSRHQRNVLTVDASNAATNAVYVYTPPLPGQDGSGVWTAGPPLNQGRAFHTCTAVGSELHVIGGETENFTGAVTAWTGIPTPAQSGAGPIQTGSLVLGLNGQPGTWTIAEQFEFLYTPSWSNGPGIIANVAGVAGRRVSARAQTQRGMLGVYPCNI